MISKTLSRVQIRRCTENASGCDPLSMEIASALTS